MVHTSGAAVEDLGEVLVHMDSGDSFAVVFLAAYQHSDESALASRLRPEHGDFDALTHIFQNVLTHRNLGKTAILTRASVHRLNYDVPI